MQKLIIPEALRKISSKLQVTSNSIIPVLSSTAKYYLNYYGFTGLESYETNTTDGDYLLFLKAGYDAGSGWLARATYVASGTFLMISFIGWNFESWKVRFPFWIFLFLAFG